MNSCNPEIVQDKASVLAVPCMSCRDVSDLLPLLLSMMKTFVQILGVVMVPGPNSTNKLFQA